MSQIVSELSFQEAAIMVEIQTESRAGWLPLVCQCFSCVRRQRLSEVARFSINQRQRKNRSAVASVIRCDRSTRSTATRNHLASGPNFLSFQIRDFGFLDFGFLDFPLPLPGPISSDFRF